MDKETLKIKLPNLRGKKKLLNVSMLNFKLPSLIKKMKLSNSWAMGELNTMILLKSPYKQILLTAMHEGTLIKSFQSNISITFQVVEGKLNFYARNKSVTLEKGQVFTLYENINYNLTTMQETVFLLTLIKGKLR